MEYYSTAYEKSMETCLITTYVLWYSKVLKEYQGIYCFLFIYTIVVTDYHIYVLCILWYKSYLKTSKLLTFSHLADAFIQSALELTYLK